MKVLIAEDDALFRKALWHLLSTEFEITAVQDGHAAATLLQQEGHPALALLDWVMPGLTGPQVCRELRANPASAGIYIILLTARNSAADIVAGLRAGADDYVTKPFQAEEHSPGSGWDAGFSKCRKPWTPNRQRSRKPWPGSTCCKLD